MSLQHSAQLRRGGQRDDRRRRLLADECLGAGSRSAASSGAVETSPARRSENYADAAFLDDQWGVLDLVPQRLAMIALLALAALALVAACEALYLWMLRSELPVGRIATFDLDARGNLSSWLSSLVLLATSIATVQVYAIRRHKADDYRGRYRVWLWAALGWFLLSADAAAGLHEGLQQAMIYWTGTKLFGDGAAWWMSFYLLLFGALGSQLLVDMRHCRLSTVTLLATAACYAAAAALRLGWMPVDAGPRHVMFESAAAMLGHVLLLLATILYARYVLLDAEGLLPRRQPRAKRAAANTSAKDNAPPPSQPAAAKDRLKIDPPQAVPQPVFARSATAGPPTPSPAATSPSISAAKPAAALSSNSPSANHKLSKAERKALRQRLEAERLKREAQKQNAWK